MKTSPFTHTVTVPKRNEATNEIMRVTPTANLSPVSYWAASPSSAQRCAKA